MLAPIKNFEWKKNTSQLFGVSRNIYLPNFDIPGHNGLDIVIQDDKRGFGSPVLAAHNGTVEKIGYDVPNRTSGNGIYIYSNEGYSTVYWHLSSFLVNVGDKVTEGQIIGTVGNSGFVFPKPTPDCETCGSHLHFAVLRHDKKDNEYGGFVDPVPFLFKSGDKLPITLWRDLFIGNEGDDVSWLQTICKLEFPETTFDPIGYFGNQTRKAVIKIQEKYGLTPTIGYCGPKTRKLLNDKYAWKL